jgi:hypothetical protein
MLVISTKIPFVSDVFFGRLSVTSTVNSTTQVINIQPNYISCRYRRCVFPMLRTIKKKLSTNYTPSLLPDKRPTLSHLISRKVLFVGTSFSFVVILRDFLLGHTHRIWTAPTTFKPSPMLPAYTIFVLISALLFLRLYSPLLKQLVHEDIPGMDFYSLFSLLYYTV